MGSISLPTMMIIAAVSTAAAGGAAAYESHQAGVATQAADKRKARVEADNETQKQISMRQTMLRSLAAQNAQAGVGGVGLSQASTMRQIKQAQNDLMVSKANSSAQVSLLDAAGKNAVEAGNVGAVGDVASATANIYRNGGFSGGSGAGSGS